MNVRLLKRIKAQILKEPEQFIMKTWFLKGENIPNCGTAACIGGWAITLGGRYKTPLDAAREYCGQVAIQAKTLLRLSDDEAHLLFYQDNWPAQFRTDRPLAERAAERIDWLIETGL